MAKLGRHCQDDMNYTDYCSIVSYIYPVVVHACHDLLPYFYAKFVKYPTKVEIVEMEDLD